MVYVQLNKSNKDDKRYKAIFYDNDKKKIKSVHFGSSVGSTYIDHKDDQTKDAWIARHSVRGTFQIPMTASSLSKNILWNKKTLKSSYEDYLKKFNLKKY